MSLLIISTKGKHKYKEKPFSSGVLKKISANFSTPFYKVSIFDYWQFLRHSDFFTYQGYLTIGTDIKRHLILSGLNWDSVLSFGKGVYLTEVGAVRAVKHAI